MRALFIPPRLPLAGILAPIILSASPIHATDEPSSYDALVPLLQTYCYDCHDRDVQKADLDLERFETLEDVLAERRTWKNAWHMLHVREMPPLDKPQPTVAERAMLTDWIEGVLATPDASGVRNPGHVPPRRLTADQYNDTVYDLLRVHRRFSFYDPKKHDGMPDKVRYVLQRQFQEPLVELPPDPAVHGFDSMAEGLTLPPFLLEKYLDASKKLTDREDVRRAFARRSAIARGEEDPTIQDELLLADYLKRAFRRPPSDAERDRYIGFYHLTRERGAGRDDAVAVALQAILVAPQFLYRMDEGVPEEEVGGVRPLNDYDLATRLSYFLWNTLPDDRLFQLADEGKLRDPEFLKVTALEMLRDPRAEEFIKSFSLQWLGIQDIASHTPDPGVLPKPEWALKYLNESYMTEVLLLFGTVVAEDRSLLDFIDPGFTWMNSTVADLYGMLDRTKEKEEKPNHHNFYRYELEDRRRGGIVAAGATLMVNSNSTHTNPVMRGKWMLETVLGQPSPPPLPDVPNLDATPVVEGGLPIREKLKLHRADPACASCHQRLDPMGLALENFDAVGVWRDRESETVPIDAAAVLSDGTPFEGVVGIKDLLLEDKRESFVRSFTEHLMAYALGRPVDYYDIATIQQIVGRLEEEDHRFSALIAEIVTSYPFRHLKVDPEDS